MSDQVIFRCDGGVGCGLGHVSRSIALAEALAERGLRPQFFGEYSAQATRLLDAAGMSHAPAPKLGLDADIEATNRASRGTRGCVLDSYDVTRDHLERLSDATRVLLIDDTAHLDAYPCAGVLNFTVRAPDLAYPAGSAQYLLGPRFMLARRALRTAPRREHASADLRNVLVALGGVDRHELTLAVLDSLRAHRTSLTVRVVVRPDDPRRSEIQARVASFAHAEVIGDLDSLAEPLAWADACVGAGGLIKYEAGLLHLPIAVLPQTTLENDDVVRCVQLGFVTSLGAPDVRGRPLREPLERFLSDASLRESLCLACNEIFRGDPTARAADGVMDILRS